MFNRYKNECLYIAGPVCFYERGYTLWDIRRRQAEYMGFAVSLPNDTKLELTNADPRKNADAIFRNCADSMNVSTGIVADLELFRGSEPDGGTVYEIGMAYARGLRCYAFGRDMRPLAARHQTATVENDRPMDGAGWELAYHDLPYCPSLVGSCRLVEGDFEDALKTLAGDIDQEVKAAARTGAQPAVKEPSATIKRNKPLVCISSPERYAPDADARIAAMETACRNVGYDVVVLRVTSDLATVVDPIARATMQFEQWQQQVRDCDIFVANVSDYHGWEPSADVAFECGMAWQLGKKCVGYMSDARIMQSRVPHYSAEQGGGDVAGFVVEDFNYPINLMFASSMPVLEGSFEQVITQI